MSFDTAASLISSVRSQRDRFVGFAFAAADLLIEVTREGRITFVAGAAQNLYGRTSENLVGTAFLDLLAPGDRPLAEALVAALDRGGRFVPVTVRLARDGTPPAVLGGCRLPNREGTVFLSLAATANPPPATGAAAGERLLERSEFADAAAKRLLDATGSYRLTLIAVDELEALQERLTAEVGHGLATAIERYLYSCTAGVDVAGEFGIGRYGLLHKDPLDAARLQEGVETLAKAVDPLHKGVTLRSTTLSLDDSGMSGTDAARALVYCINEFANSDGGDLSIPSLREGLDRALAQTVTRVGQLRTAVAERAFDLVFQPIVAFASRQLHHLEALTRFRHGESPGSTVAFAEAVRLIADFDLAVAEQVVALALTRPEGAAPIAINVSGRSLESSIFANALFALLRADRSLSRRLLFEVTESAVITRTDEVNARIQALRGGGFRVCLDDFGAGANSFHYLRSFEVDFIKIDGAFAQAALRNPRDKILLRTVSRFCREIGVATIVEMVEDEDQAAAFAKLGIGFAQGYYFGRPAALSEEPVSALPRGSLQMAASGA